MKHYSNPHNQAVYEFLQKCRNEDPNRYSEVCQRYPTINARQWRRIRDREHLSGLNPHQEEYGIETEE